MNAMRARNGGFICFPLGCGPPGPADATLRIAGQPHLVPAACERIEQHQAAGKGLADAREQLDRLQRLERAHDTHQGSEDAHRGATLLDRLRILGEQAVIARRVRAAQVEYRHLAVEADAGPGYQGLASGDACPVQRMTRREVVRAIEDYVGGPHQGREPFGAGALFEGLDTNVGIEPRRGRGRGRALGLAERIEPVDHLALQVGEVDLVAVTYDNVADAARSEVEKRGGAESAGADHQGRGSGEALLRLLAELVQQQVAAVGKALAIVHRGPEGRRYFVVPAAVVAPGAAIGRPLRWLSAAASCRSSFLASLASALASAFATGLLSAAVCPAAGPAMILSVGFAPRAAGSTLLSSSTDRWCCRSASRSSTRASAASSTTMSGAMPLAWIERPPGRE